MYAIHRSQRSLVVVEQPDAAGVALALLDQRLDEDAEEAVDVRLAHQQIERELDGVALDVGHALGAAALVGLARQRLSQRVDLRLGRRVPARARSSVERRVGRSARSEIRMRRLSRRTPTTAALPIDAGALQSAHVSIMRQVAPGSVRHVADRHSSESRSDTRTKVADAC